MTHCVMRKQTARKVQDVDLEEVSVVDSPANRVPGWILMKSSSEADELRSVLEDSEFIEGAPEAVRDAAQLMLRWLEALEQQEEREEQTAPVGKSNGTLEAAFGAALRGHKVELN